MFTDKISNHMRRFRKSEDGNPTLEFVILFPMFIFLFLTGFEAGYYMVRNVMLERGVDLAIRDVRLSNGNVPDFVELKQNICAQAAIIPDCVNSIQIEMQQIQAVPGDIAKMAGPARCIDRESDEDALKFTNFDTGGQNQLMALRICALSQPLFPTTGIGVGMRRNGAGDYAMVATAAFVTEPGNRAIANAGGNQTSGGIGDGS